jgi:hypothetical protein
MPLRPGGGLRCTYTKHYVNAQSSFFQASWYKLSSKFNNNSLFQDKDFNINRFIICLKVQRILKDVVCVQNTSTKMTINQSSCSATTLTAVSASPGFR